MEAEMNCPGYPVYDGASHETHARPECYEIAKIIKIEVPESYEDWLDFCLACQKIHQPRDYYEKED
jgi:hypothetical protein